MIYFISDTHFGHENVLLHCPNRNFETIEDMNEALISNWNERVTDEDDVYILGDFSYRSKTSVSTILDRLNGRLHLIVGNHDHKWMQNVNLAKYFVSVSHTEIIEYDKKYLTLSHYPMLEWFNSRYAGDITTSTSFLIHGHMHERTPEESGTVCYIRDHLPCALNAGVDINGMRPVTLEELIENNRIFYGR